MSIAVATVPSVPSNASLTRPQSLAFGSIALTTAALMFGQASCLAAIPGATPMLLALSAAYGLLGGRLVLGKL